MSFENIIEKISYKFTNLHCDIQQVLTEIVGLPRYKQKKDKYTLQLNNKKELIFEIIYCQQSYKTHILPGFHLDPYWTLRAPLLTPTLVDLPH